MLLTFLSIDEGPRRLGDDEAHLWTAPLDRACDEHLLTVEEQARAQRFKMERIRRQFIASRGQLRTLLGWYLGMNPDAIPIVTEPSGKPFLHSSLGDSLHFNVTHSDVLAIFAITRRGRIGVDVERWRDIPNMDGLVERFFTRRECEIFATIQPVERQTAFFHAWTRKEAALKAIGRGVQSLDQCDVTFRPGEPEQVLRMGADSQASDKWLLRTWRPTPHYVAAVAVELSRSDKC